MSEHDDKRPKFFRDVHELTQEHGVIAYVVVGVVKKDDALAVATGAGSRIDENHEAAEKIFIAMDGAFDEAMIALAMPGGMTPGSGGLLN